MENVGNSVTQLAPIWCRYAAARTLSHNPKLCAVQNAPLTYVEEMHCNLVTGSV